MFSGGLESCGGLDTSYIPGTLLYDWMALLVIKTISQPILKIRKPEISLSKVTMIAIAYIDPPQYFGCWPRPILSHAAGLEGYGEHTPWGPGFPVPSRC